VIEKVTHSLDFHIGKPGAIPLNLVVIEDNLLLNLLIAQRYKIKRFAPDLIMVEI
jgi:hypothetical protein